MHRLNLQAAASASSEHPEFAKGQLENVLVATRPARGFLQRHRYVVGSDGVAVGVQQQQTNRRPLISVKIYNHVLHGRLDGWLLNLYRCDRLREVELHGFDW